MPKAHIGDDDRRDGVDDRPGGKVGRQDGDATRRTSKRNMQSAGTPTKKKDNNTLSPGVIVDRPDGDDDRPGGNVGRQVGNATPRTSKRQMQSTGTPANKNKKGLTAETASGPKRNDGDDDSDDDRPGGNVGRQEGNATPWTSKRHMQSTGTPANKKKKD